MMGRTKSPLGTVGKILALRATSSRISSRTDSESSSTSFFRRRMAVSR